MTETSDLNDVQPPDRPLDLFGVIAVICLAVVPDIYNAVVIFICGREESTNFSFMAVSILVRSIQVSIPLLLIIKLSKIDWGELGLSRMRWGRDCAAAIGLWLAAVTAYYLACFMAYAFLPESLLTSQETEFEFEGPSRIYDYGLLLAVSCANGFAEEFVIRGYLLTRLERLLDSTLPALLITSVLFAAYHIYQGVGPAFGILGVGLVFGGAFCLGRRLWPLVLAHSLMDFIGMLYM